MRHIRTILSTLLLFLTITAQAQRLPYKVEESSDRKMPEWVNSAGKDYLSVTATAADIETAKAAVLENVRKQIAQSIATRVVSESTLTTSAVQSDSGLEKTQTLESSILSRTAKLPFIGEISLSRASEYYWERRRDRSTGEITYFYAVKYPFTEFEMKKIVLEYQMHDRSLNEKLDSYASGTDLVTSVEQIGETLNELRAFQSEFDPLDPRYDRVQSISAAYRQLYDRILVSCVQKAKGVIAVSLSLDGRSISTTQKPQIKSGCASQITSAYEGNTLVIRYSDEYCYEDDDNTITVRFRTGNKYISETVHFTL